MEEYFDAQKIIETLDGENLRVADLAAGIGWTSALLSKLKNIGEVHSIEISEHRIKELFEHSILMMQGEAEKIHRYIGSFYDLKFESSSIDIVFLSQAFHHADYPFKLLVECDRVLKPGGYIILIGEHYFGKYDLIKGFLSSLLKKQKFETRFHRLFPPDHELGDHYYRVSDYEFIFRNMGYNLQMKIAKTGKAMYYAKKQL